MRLFDVDSSEQTLQDDKPVFSKSSFGQGLDAERKDKLKKLMN
jgi:hypothetical protein